MKSVVIILSVLALFTSCEDKTVKNSELYIGTYRIMDQMIPYPYIIQQNKDTIILYDNNGIRIDKVINARILKNQKIKLKHKEFKVLNKKDESFLAFDILDTIQFRTFENGNPNPKNAAQFVKIAKAKNIDIQKIENEIASFVWNYSLIEDENSNPNNDLKIEQLIHFKKDSLFIITSYYYQGSKTVAEKEKKAYKIFEIDNTYFISFQKEKNNPQPIYQIVDYDVESITLKDFSSRKIKNIRFYKNTLSIEKHIELFKNTSYYSNCFDGYQGEYYFGEDVTFKKGNKFIIDYVKQNAPETDVNSGYIIVHYNINCNFEVGKFGLIQMDREFQMSSFSKEMVNHILNKVKRLKDFPSSNSQIKWLHYKDVHAFLMFKLEKGKIVDVCP